MSQKTVMLRKPYVDLINKIQTQICFCFFHLNKKDINKNTELFKFDLSKLIFSDFE